MPALAARRDVHGLALLLSCGLLLCGLSGSGGSSLFSGSLFGGLLLCLLLGGLLSGGLFRGFLLGLFFGGLFGGGLFRCFLLGLFLGGLLGSSFFSGFLLGLLLGGLFGGSLFSGFLLSLFLCCLLLGDCLLLCGVIGRGICGFTADREKYEEGGDNILPAAAFRLFVRLAGPLGVVPAALDAGFCGFWGGGTMGGRFAGSTPSVSGRSSNPPVWAFFVPPIFSVFW